MNTRQEIEAKQEKRIHDLAAKLDIGDIKINGFTVTISHDDDPLSPRDWDNFGKMACWHSHYLLGDEQPKTDPADFLREVLVPLERAGGIVLPLYLYDHGGVSISTGAFSCPWDSGQVGYIYADADTIRREFAGKGKRITKQVRARAVNCLLTEVDTYDKYLSGDVWGYRITDKDGDDIDSCWGFFGLNDAKEEAARSLAYWQKTLPEQLSLPLAVTSGHEVSP